MQFWFSNNVDCIEISTALVNNSFYCESWGAEYRLRVGFASANVILARCNQRIWGQTEKLSFKHCYERNLLVSKVAAGAGY